MVETTGEYKKGIDINYKGQWGYHLLIVSLANTGGPLFIVNRSVNRPSHEHAARYLDQSVKLCRDTGFCNILLRGDTDFSQTTELDRWDEGGVRFVFGIQACHILNSNVGNIEAMGGNRWNGIAVKSRPICGDVLATPNNGLCRNGRGKTSNWWANTCRNLNIHRSPATRRIDLSSCGKSWNTSEDNRNYLMTRLVFSTSPTIGICQP